MPETILIADDEQDIVRLLQDYFEINGYEVLTAYSGAETLRQAERGPDIILLDVNLPDFDGFSICTRIRSHVSCPILFLTARVEDSDRIRGFGAGGDDYIVKPFSLDVLGARVAAHLRREERSRRKTSARFSGELAVDYGQRCVTCRGEALPLARKEFDIVEFLSTNAGQVFDKERIYERVWGFDGQGDSSVVAEHIRRIRAKLAAAGCQNHIETVWGVGYKWKN